MTTNTAAQPLDIIERATGIILTKALSAASTVIPEAQNTQVLDTLCDLVLTLKALKELRELVVENTATSTAH